MKLVICDMRQQRRKNIESQVNALAYCAPKLRKFILANSKVDLIKTLCNCVSNALFNPDIRFSDKQKKKLKKYKKLILQLVDEKIPLADKKSKLIHRGSGLLSALLPVVLSKLGTILFKDG